MPTQTPREDLACRNSVPPTVLGWHDGSGVLLTALGELWRCVEQLGWFQPSMSRIVIQIGQRWRSTLSLETALSLAQFLVQRAPHTRIEIFDPAAGGCEWEAFAVCDVVTEAPVCLAD